MPRPALHSQLVDTVVGPLLVVGGPDGVAAIIFADARSADELRADTGAAMGCAILDTPHPIVARARRQIESFTAGRRRTFNVQLDPHGTPFQRAVWDEISRIPRGQTISYSALAARVARPTAVRAVASACARNPLPVVVPCHRVIQANGQLGSYAGGAEAKRRLLALERRGSTDLPLFTVATDRSRQRTLERREDVVMDALRADLRGFVDTLEQGRADRIEAGDWLAAVLDECDPDALTMLAARVAGSTRPEGTRLLVAEDLVAAAVAEFDERVSSITVLDAALRAAAAVESAWFRVLVTRVLGRPRLASRWRDRVREVLEEIVAGRTGASSRFRDSVALLWGRVDGASIEHLPPHQQLDQLCEAGRWRDAAQVGETALGSGDGDRAAVLRSLVRCYEQLGLLDQARLHLVSLTIESSDAEATRRLRELDDRLRSQHT